MTTITQKEAYELAAKLAKEGMPYKKIGLELARRGWVSRKTGKAVGMTGISIIVKKMKNPKYKPMGFKIRRYVRSVNRYQPRANGVATEPKANGSTTHISQYLNMGQRGAMDTLQIHGTNLRRVADAIDNLLAAIR